MKPTALKTSLPICSGFAIGIILNIIDGTFNLTYTLFMSVLLVIVCAIWTRYDKRKYTAYLRGGMKIWD